MDDRSYLALGIMSGSSLDGMDLALCRIVLHGSTDRTGSPDATLVRSFEVLEADTLPYSELWQRRLKNLPEQDALNFAKTHTYFGHLTADFVRQFLQRTDLRPDLIASHGHTVFHDPERRLSIQIGDGAATAALTGIPTITQFRTQDIALDGEGAPIVPLFERCVLPEYDLFLNLGGIANLTYREPNGTVRAMDLTGANQPLNALAAQLDLPYDEGGRIAATGTLLPELLAQLDGQPYFQKPAPKSLGNDWVVRRLTLPALNFPAPIPDKLRTVTEHIARQIAAPLAKLIRGKEQRLLVTGGGAYHTFLLDRLRANLEESNTPVRVEVGSDVLVSYKEAMLMAFLGVLRVEKIPTVLHSVTGARRATVNGAIYHGS